MIWWFWALTLAGTFLLGYRLGKPAKRAPRVWTLSQIEELRDRLNGDRVEIVDGAPWVYGRDFTMGDRVPDTTPKSSPEAVAEILDSWGDGAGRDGWAASVGDAVDRQAKWDANPVYCNRCGLRCETEWQLVHERGIQGVFHPSCVVEARAERQPPLPPLDPPLRFGE